jgi:ADP-heptose:LPS heptosyltransferase
MRLLIFKVNQLGDNIVFLPVVQRLEQALPDVHITLMTSPTAAALYERCTPRVQLMREQTAVFNGAWKHPATWLRLRGMARAIKPDACFLANDQGNVAHLLAWMSGAKIRVGPRESNCRLRPLLSQQVPLVLAEPVALQNWRLATSLLKALGVDDAAPDRVPAPDVSAMRSGVSPTNRFVLIHPGASRAYQRWPLLRYIELANRLCEYAAVEFIQQDADTARLLDPRVRRLEVHTLESLFERMDRAALFIGNNSGPMHVASVLGVPGLILAGPSAAHWKPLWHTEKFILLRDPDLACQPCDRDDGPVNRCLNRAEPMACMNRISVERVLRTALERLGLS